MNQATREPTTQELKDASKILEGARGYLGEISDKEFEQYQEELAQTGVRLVPVAVGYNELNTGYSGKRIDSNPYSLERFQRIHS